LEQMVSEGKFRSDLFYRLNVLPLYVPPLRERKDDIEPLAMFFCRKFSVETKKDFIGFSQEAFESLHSYFWPGNIRELENSIERACVLGKPPFINAEDLRLNIKNYSESVDDIQISDGDRTLKTALYTFKRKYVTKILEESKWNQTEAGKILGVQRTYVSRLMNELDIR